MATVVSCVVSGLNIVKCKKCEESESGSVSLKSPGKVRRTF